MEAEPGEFPSLAIILNAKTRALITSGVLVRSRVVLTLGYNFFRDSLGPGDIIVALGTFNRSIMEESRQEFNVTQVVINPGMIATFASTAVPDLALIQLDKDADLNRRVKVFPAKFINSDRNLDNQMRRTTCVTYGYGMIVWNEYEKILPRTLQKYVVQMQSFKDCDAFSTAVGFPWDNKFWLCSINEDLTSSRPGDGGNPLLCDFEGEQVLHGLTSGGPSGPINGWSFYTRLSTQHDWIITNMQALQNE